MIASKTLQSGFTMPVYGMGMWEMGGRFDHDPHNDDKADLAALHLALDRGVTHFDTAESYAAGYCERLLGHAIADADRSSLFIVSKASADNHSPEALRRSFEASCERIGTDYLDMYMLHRMNTSVPIDETMGVLCQLVDEGSLRFPAVSNFTVERLQAAQAVSRYPIVANQLHYNLQVREAERYGLVEHCQQNNVMLIAWAPVQKGDLDVESQVLAKMAAKYDRTPMQVAINWLVSQQSVVTLSKTRNPAHLDENIAATTFTMEPADIEALRRETPNQIMTSNRVPLDYA